MADGDRSSGRACPPPPGGFRGARRTGSARPRPTEPENPLAPEELRAPSRLAAGQGDDPEAPVFRDVEEPVAVGTDHAAIFRPKPLSASWAGIGRGFPPSGGTVKYSIGRPFGRAQTRKPFAPGRSTSPGRLDSGDRNQLRRPGSRRQQNKPSRTGLERQDRLAVLGERGRPSVSEANSWCAV